MVNRDSTNPYLFGPPGPESGSESFYRRAKIVRKTLIPTVLWLLFDYLSSKNDVNVPSKAVLQIRIRIHRIHMFLGILDPDPLFRGMDPDPSIIKQKIVRKTLIPTSVLWLLFDYFSSKNDVNVPSKSNKQKNFFFCFFFGVLSSMTKIEGSGAWIRGSGSVSKCHGSATLDETTWIFVECDTVFSSRKVTVHISTTGTSIFPQRSVSVVPDPEKFMFCSAGCALWGAGVEFSSVAYR